MIIFKRIRYKNFLASGNQFIEIVLNAELTTLILGINGSGKSTLLDAICFVLYKKPFRKINLDQLINRVNNADCVVEVEFSIGSKEYVVRRGLKPAFMDLLIDGEQRLHEAAGKDDQEYLVQDILKVNYDAFIQVVILGNAKYVPFMQLVTGKRREFVEHVLDIGMFSTMNDVLGDRVKTLKLEMATNGSAIVSVKEQIALIQGFIKKLETEQKKAFEEIDRQIEEQQGLSDGLGIEIGEYVKEREYLLTTIADADYVTKTWDKLQAEKQKLRTTTEMKLQAIEKEKKTMETRIKAIQEYIVSYDALSACDTCGQEIQSTHKRKIIGQKRKEISGIQESMKECDPQAAKLREDASQAYLKNKAAQESIQTRMQEIGEVNAKIGELITKGREATAKQQGITQFIKKLRADLRKEPGNIQEQTDKLRTTEAKLERLEQEKKEGLDLQRFYAAAGIMLKDTGIKAAIIRQYLPSINKLVNKYLAELDFFVSFSLDENFDETFKSRYRDTLSYHNFSQGEKLRIDLALLFAWREIAKQKNSCATNLLILDEVIDGSMDANGTDLFIKLLNEELQGSNVFVISHKNDAALDKFRATLRFVREHNFSKLMQEA